MTVKELIAALSAFSPEAQAWTDEDCYTNFPTHRVTRVDPTQKLGMEGTYIVIGIKKS